MDRITRLIGLVLAVPVLALFGGVGILALQIGDTWQPADTRALISGITASCTGGAIVLALLLGLIVGVPLALRAYSAAAHGARRWDDQMPPPPDYRRALPPPRAAAWLEQPPAVQGGQQPGQWLSHGPGAYDLMDDGTIEDGEWQR
jgi:hypothetical protein